MVKEELIGWKRIYICQRCGFKYGTRKWAKACEDWEKVNKSCNVEIIAHAIKE